MNGKLQQCNTQILTRYEFSDSLQKNIVGYHTTSWSSTYLHRRVVRRDNTGTLVYTTTLITIPVLGILKRNDSCTLILQFPFHAEDEIDLTLYILGATLYIPEFLSSDAEACLTKVRGEMKK